VSGALALAACSSMPDWMSVDALKPAPIMDTVRFESEPPGAEAKFPTDKLAARLARSRCGQFAANRHLLAQRLPAGIGKHRSDLGGRKSDDVAAQSGDCGTHAGSAAAETGQEAGGQKEDGCQTCRKACSSGTCSCGGCAGAATGRTLAVCAARAALGRLKPVSMPTPGACWRNAACRGWTLWPISSTILYAVAGIEHDIRKQHSDT